MVAATGMGAALPDPMSVGLLGEAVAGLLAEFLRQADPAQSTPTTTRLTTVRASARFICDCAAKTS